MTVAPSSNSPKSRNPNSSDSGPDARSRLKKRGVDKKKGDLHWTMLKVAGRHLILIVTVLLITFLPSTVRSDPDSIRLPSDEQINDLCPVNSSPDHCPVKCFRTDPVCGEDGVTYWCGCADAHCAGVRVKKLGFCELGNGGSGPAGQALLLVHIIWLILLGIFVLFGLL